MASHVRHPAFITGRSRTEPDGAGQMSRVHSYNHIKKHRLVSNMEPCPPGCCGRDKLMGTQKTNFSEEFYDRRAFTESYCSKKVECAKHVCKSETVHKVGDEYCCSGTTL